MRLLTDVTPLRDNPAFLRLWCGTMLSQSGGAMTAFAIALQVYDMTRSTAAVGGLGVAELVPLLVVALPGGSLADMFGRRGLVLVMTVCQAAASAALFAQALLGLGSLWLMYLLAAVLSATGAVSTPARATFIPLLVPAGQRPTAIALNRVIFQVTMIAGPALGGVVAAAFGVRGCYLTDTVTFAGVLYGVGRLPASPGPTRRRGQRMSVRSPSPDLRTPPLKRGLRHCAAPRPAGGRCCCRSWRPASYPGRRSRHTLGVWTCGHMRTSPRRRPRITNWGMSTKVPWPRG